MKLLTIVFTAVCGLLVMGCGSSGSRDDSQAVAPATSQTPIVTPPPAPGGTAPVGTAGGATPTQPPASGLGQVFPADNPWNTDISNYPVHARSANYIASIGANTGLHSDFGTVYNGAPNGIPYVVVPANQAMVPITFNAYPGESDPGPYPVPANAPIEGGPNGTGDRHVIVVDPARRRLYELFNAAPDPLTGGWQADSGAVFDLDSNNLRPAGWTSADAAGLPIFPGLVRYDEVVGQGEIKHALRFTVVQSQRAYIEPARHFASSSTDPNRPPMGLRLRLKASVDISGFPTEVQVILRALKKYGMFMADNGSNWFISGAPDPRWNDSNLATIGAIKGSDFEAIETGPLITQ